MSWVQMARWAGRTDVITGPSTVKSSWVKMYRDECRRQGKEPVKQNNPDTYMRSFSNGFVYRLKERLQEMRGEQSKSSGDSLALALRDAVQVAREEMWRIFPDLAPHPANCQCNMCKSRRKPVKYKKDDRAVDYAAWGRGSKAGDEARIEGRGGKLRCGQEALDK